jgi:hypothetical protein
LDRETKKGGEKVAGPVSVEAEWMRRICGRRTFLFECSKKVGGKKYMEAGKDICKLREYIDGD